jgi:hypothetical protein
MRPSMSPTASGTSHGAASPRADRTGMVRADTGGVTARTRDRAASGLAVVPAWPGPYGHCLVPADGVALGPEEETGVTPRPIGGTEAAKRRGMRHNSPLGRAQAGLLVRYQGHVTPTTITSTTPERGG